MRVVPDFADIEPLYLRPFSIQALQFVRQGDAGTVCGVAAPKRERRRDPPAQAPLTAALPWRTIVAASGPPD